MGDIPHADTGHSAGRVDALMSLGAETAPGLDLHGMVCVGGGWEDKASLQCVSSAELSSRGDV